MKGFFITKLNTLGILLFTIFFLFKQNTIREQMAHAAEPKEKEYEVQEVVASRIDEKTLTAQFRVKWSGYSHNENTWEPLDQIYQIPLILKNFTKKKRAALTRPLRSRKSDEALKSIGNFEGIPKEIVRRFNDPLEFIPTGKEEVEVFVSEILSDKGNYLWQTFFKGDPMPCFLRKCVAAYYWPYEAALFMALQVNRCAKIKRGQQGISQPD